jgi:hypothetical protein
MTESAWQSRSLFRVTAPPISISSTNNLDVHLVNVSRPVAPGRLRHASISGFSSGEFEPFHLAVNVPVV